MTPALYDQYLGSTCLAILLLYFAIRFVKMWFGDDDK